MAKRKAHERSLARARAKRYQERRRVRRRRRFTVSVVALLAVVAALAMVLSLLPRPAPVIEEEDVPSPTPREQMSPEPSPTAAVACGAEEPEAAAAAKPTYEQPPDQVIEEGRSYRATISTSCGDLVVDLYADRAPRTVNNFVFLAREDFYDGLIFHRVVPGFVIQGGDPEGSGAGGPGYQFEDELDLAREQGYAPGSLAMANSGPDTNGSQFFVVLPGGEQALQPNYNLFGGVVEGLDVAERIAQVPLADQRPQEVVYIEDIVIEESDS